MLEELRFSVKIRVSAYGENVLLFTFNINNPDQNHADLADGSTDQYSTCTGFK